MFVIGEVPCSWIVIVGGEVAVFVVGERPWARRKTNLLVEGRKAVHVYRLLPWARS